eukprot:CAMPEP_0174308278 /NCGR_PEP_ID=MMETSP0810-20121108/1651_1 /TAXON_ID=73025 ORGANISM="Eutreptiella gymnastica-like, Strain CCMP1594" /NCGR_SAMPLE_ID=MMETSP0810 /ASSEMBLY_ACC=CAM_ASM_000659 /LENGTH=130 /DNA_ID=CAMNT_0015415553 /DNA_START=296 /DNA_END=685 /DNA_ORIENTATION=-
MRAQEWGGGGWAQQCEKEKRRRGVTETVFPVSTSHQSTGHRHCRQSPATRPETPVVGQEVRAHDSHTHRPKMALDRRGSTAAAPEHSQRPHDREFTPGVRRRWLGHASLCASISASRPYYRTGLMARDAG